jgi:hypothetical protein
MPREVKQGRRAFAEEAVPTPTHAYRRPAAPSAMPYVRLAAASRWFAALDPEAAPPPEPHRVSPFVLAAAAPFLLGAVLSAALVNGAVLRTVLPASLLAVAWVVVRRLSGLGLFSATPSDAAGVGTASGQARGIAMDGERLAFRRGSGLRASDPGDVGLETLVVLGAPFGVTLLASPRRDRLIALLSSASGMFYLGAPFDAAARRAFAPLLDRAFTVVGDDAGLEAIGPDGEPLVLAPDELASLLDALVEQSPTCLDRFVLTDARGASLTLDGRHLCVGERAVDLNAPLEWKPIVFQEALGQAVAVYQGTWIRQSATEMWLVSLLPPLGPAPGADLDLGSLDRAVLRDLRLMQSTPEAPPPNEQRVAIDRLFMLPVRSALDRAPRASHQPNRAQA